MLVRRRGIARKSGWDVDDDHATRRERREKCISVDGDRMTPPCDADGDGAGGHDNNQVTDDVMSVNPPVR